MKKVLRQFSVHQTSKVLAIMTFFVGFLFVPIGAAMLYFGTAAQTRGMGLAYVLLPFIYGIFCYPFFALYFWLYNIVARVVGGIEVSVETKNGDA